MKTRLSVYAIDSGSPPRSSTLELLITIDPSLPPTSTLASLNGGDPSGDASNDALTNIYLIIFITFGVAISFVILVVAICFMSRGQRGRRPCCGPTVGRVKGTQVKANGDVMDYYAPGTMAGVIENGVTFSNGGGDYMTTAGSTSYTMEKGSPVQYTQSEGSLSILRHRWQNSEAMMLEIS